MAALGPSWGRLGQSWNQLRPSSLLAFAKTSMVRKLTPKNQHGKEIDPGHPGSLWLPGARMVRKLTPGICKNQQWRARKCETVSTFWPSLTKCLLGKSWRSQHGLDAAFGVPEQSWSCLGCSRNHLGSSGAVLEASWSLMMPTGGRESGKR